MIKFFSIEKISTGDNFSCKTLSIKPIFLIIIQFLRTKIPQKNSF